jgi:hypothetical protein
MPRLIEPLRREGKGVLHEGMQDLVGERRESAIR